MPAADLATPVFRCENAISIESRFGLGQAEMKIDLVNLAFNFHRLILLEPIGQPDPLDGTPAPRPERSLGHHARD